MGKILIVMSLMTLLTACAATPAPQVVQERQACAQAGIAPNDPGYASCVADLDAALAQSRIQIN